MGEQRSSVRTARPLPHLATALVCSMVAVVLGPGTAFASNGNLPGGTAISVAITAPTPGAVKVFPPGHVQLQGTASVGAGLPVANTALVYTLDVSGSTDQVGGCGGDQNGDGNADFILDCEIAAAKALNNTAISTGTVGDVGAAVFAESGATGDVGPAAGDQVITGPATDANGAGGPDVEEVLGSAFSDIGGGDGGLALFTPKTVGNTTNFSAGISSALTAAAASSKPNKIVVFMSDGGNNTGADVSTVLPSGGVVFDTFAIGSAATCANDPSGLGSLQEVANLTGGTCTDVPDLSSLPDVVPGVIAAQLISLDLSVDLGAPVDISGDVSQPLPAADPVSVTFSHLVSGLAPGQHQLCVTANGSDGGGAGSVTDCVQVLVASISLSPPSAFNELGTPGQTHTATATVQAGAFGGVSGVTVNFDILSGPNAGITGSAVTDVAGQATFTYTATQGPSGIGTDTIQACFTDEQGDAACAQATKTWGDTTPPAVGCTETTNPHGNQIPPAGTTPPGTGGGQNPDGFYELTATDAVDPNPEVFVVDTGSGTVFGPFSSGTRIKYTEAKGTTPRQLKIGSTNGKAGAVDWHIFGTGDAAVYAVDASGNRSAAVSCLVPPPPK